MALFSGRGVAGSVTVGAIQPDWPGWVASCLYSSRLTVSAGQLSKGSAKRATLLPRHLVRGAGAVGDSK